MARQWLRIALAIAVATTIVDAQTDSATNARETVDRYCSGCHNERARIAGLALNLAGPGVPAADSAVWEKAVRKLRMRTMPPVGAPRPDEATYKRLTTWLETQLDRAAAVNPNPGAPRCTVSIAPNTPA